MANNVIYKYPLRITDEQYIEVSPQAVPLSVINQNENVCLYMFTDRNAAKKQLNVRIIGTGHPIEASLLRNYSFVGTVSTVEGSLIWHIFIERNYP